MILHLLKNLLRFLLLLLINILKLLIRDFILRSTSWILAHSDQLTATFLSRASSIRGSFFICWSWRNTFLESSLRWRHWRVLGCYVGCLDATLLAFARQRFHEFAFAFWHFFLGAFLVNWEHLLLFAALWTGLDVCWELRLVSFINSLDWYWLFVQILLRLLLLRRLRVKALSCIIH